MTVFLFPGQGSQTPGMGLDFYEGSAEAKAVLDRSAAVLGATFLETMFQGPEEAVTNTRFTQPALVSVGVAIASHLQSMHVTPSACAGHSVGEFAALVAAGALTLEDALELTRERGRLMSENVPAGGMAAVMGLEPHEIESALPEGAEVANYNGPQQTIISGSNEGLDRAEAALKAAGARRVMRLKVSGPFHSSFMRDASEQFRSLVEKVTLHVPRVRFVSSVSGVEERDPGRIRTLLWQQISGPVRWTEVMRTLGPVPAAECGPGHVLQGIAKRMDGAPHVSPAGTMAAAEALEFEEAEAEEHREELH